MKGFVLLKNTAFEGFHNKNHAKQNRLLTKSTWPFRLRLYLFFNPVKKKKK